MVPGGQYRINYKSRKDVFTLWAVGDIHNGNKACAVDKLKQDVQRIKDDPNARWLGTGDYAEFIGHTDKRFDPDAVAENISVSDLRELGPVLMRQVRDFFMPIKDKCIGILQGNHELKYEERFQQRLTAWLAAELETKCFDYSTIFDLVFKRLRGTTRRFRVYAHHGAGYAITSGGKLNRLIGFMHRWPKADIVIIGHVHEKMMHKNVPLDGNDKCSKIVQTPQVGIITGSYLKTYSEGVTTYGEQRGYSPVALGAAAIIIKPDTGEMEVR